MQVFTKVTDLKAYLNTQKQGGRSVGFVPTMGALHEGHASLVTKAKQENDLVVVSIFVNPTQFNNPDDLKKYPRTIEKDTALLSGLGCDAVLIPEVSEIYPEDFQLPEISLGVLDEVMEGEHRPGHFKGVIQVVYRLFQIVEPDRAYFGLKDFQQIAVIRHMTHFFNLPVEIIAVPTLREVDGLAMSSRNLRLNADERQKAVHISKTLYKAKSWSEIKTPEETRRLAIDYFQTGGLELEYFEIVDPITLQSLQDQWVPGAVACIVAYAGEVRLIDNMELVIRNYE